MKAPPILEGCRSRATKSKACVEDAHGTRAESDTEDVAEIPSQSLVRIGTVVGDPIWSTVSATARATSQRSTADSTGVDLATMTANQMKASVLARASWLGVGVLFVTSLFGCTNALVRNTAGHVGCPQNEIRISDEQGSYYSRSWTASCRSRRYFCTLRRRPTGAGGNDTDVACAEEAPRQRPVLASSSRASSSPRHATPSPAAASASPAAAAPRQPSVERAVRDGQAEFLARLSLESPSVQVGHAPGRDAEAVFIAMNFEQGPSRATCAAGLLVDGAVERTPFVRSTPRAMGEQVTVRTTIAVLRRLASATHVSLRVCDTSIELGSSDLETMRELVRRIDEERAWRESASATGAAEPPR